MAYEKDLSYNRFSGADQPYLATSQPKVRLNLGVLRHTPCKLYIKVSILLHVS